jgi:hypothetical protein
MAHTRDGIAYAGGSETSYEAAIRARKFVSDQGIEVLHWLQGRSDGTQKEAERQLHISRASLCARFKALEDAGAIRKTSTKREGCFAYVATGHQPPTQLGMF